jgi:pyrroline-5-carboxylate reductase
MNTHTGQRVPNNTSGPVMLDKKIAFIGSGAMAEAMISSLLGQNLARPENLHASDSRLERVQELHEKYAR